MEPTISFFNCVSTKKKATEETLKNLRDLYPKAYIMLACDACESYMDLCEKYNCEYFHSMSKLGYPVQPIGYTIEGAIDWMTRFYLAALRCGTSHIMMMEDDIVLTRKLTIDSNAHLMCIPVDPTSLQPESRLPPVLMDLIYQFSGKYPNVDWYAGGGGAIFKTSTIIDHYPEIIKFFKTTGRIIQNHVYPTIGWIDCFMALYIFLAGKDMVNNPNMTQLYNCHSVEDYDKAYHDLKDKYEIIAHYKKYY
jgi:hypothetical protein